MEPKGLPMTRETMTRVRIAVLIYSMVNAVLFGAGLIFVLTLPVLSAHSGFWISGSCWGEPHFGSAHRVVDRPSTARPLWQRKSRRNSNRRTDVGASVGGLVRREP
jgi:hypothetical protein